jgi:hypothetical protein
MATNATIVLDSGVFLVGLASPGPWDVGYFQSRNSLPDIRVYADGKAVDSDPPLHIPTGNSTLEVRHLGADGSIKRGPLADDLLPLHRLTLDKLYGNDKEIDKTAFDCIIRFHSGYFRPSMIKTRRFKLDPPPTAAGIDPAKAIDTIAHDVVVYYAIDDGEELRLVAGNQTIWTSKNHSGSPTLLELEFVADHTNAVRFYADCLKQHRGGHWLPNQGDPPPNWPGSK